MTQQPALPPPLKCALAYAKRGLAVIPMHGKRAYFEDWPNKKSTDPETIRQWYEADPTANVAIVPDGTFCIIDIDPRSGGDETIAKLEREHGALPETITSETGGGGWHQYFKIEPDRKLVYEPGQGVQILGAGRAAVEFPSIHPETGKAYQWAADRHPGALPMAPAPAWVYAPDLPPKTNGTVTNGTRMATDPGVNAYCRRALDSERMQLVHQKSGGRNSALNTAALALATLHHYGAFGEDEARAALRAACEANGLIADDGEKSFDKTFASGWRAGAAQPRTVLDLERRPTLPPPPIVERHAAAGTEPPLRLPLVYFRDVLATTTAQYVVKGWINRGELALIVGEPGCGKSFFSEYMGGHAAAGLDFYGYRVHQGGVVYLAGEGGTAVFDRRSAMRRHLVLPDTLPFAIIQGSINLRERDADIALIVARILEAEKSFGVPVGLVVVDTLSRVLAGGDENSSEDMGSLLLNMDRIRAETGAAVAVVHHLPKDGARGRGGRGSGVIWGAIDTQIEVDRDPVSKVITAKVSKQRNGAEGAELKFELKQVVLATDADGDEITSCELHPTDRVTSPKTKLSDAASICLQALQRAIEKGGTVAPACRDIPRGVLVVAESLWREIAYAMQVSGGNTERAKQMAFQKATETLIRAGMVGKWQELVWMIGSKE